MNSPAAEKLRARARASWAAGNWDDFSALITPVGELALERAAVAPGMRLLDAGTGSGGNVAIPAALRGARVTGSDITPELFVHARRRAAEAGVEVEWVEADAQELPFPDASFERVISTFGAMFAPDHTHTAAELVRVCAPGGRIVMTTWVTDGFAGELFKLTGSFMPPPPPGAQTPPQWGAIEHIEATFAKAGARPGIVRETVGFAAPSVAALVARYVDDFGPFVVLRGVIEPQGRWPEFLEEFAALVGRFNRATDGTASIESDYLVITVDR